MRESLVKEYSRLYKDISLSPFGEELNDDALRVPIDKNYCKLNIVKIKGNRQSEHPTAITHPVKSFLERVAELETEMDFDNKFSSESGYELETERDSDTEFSSESDYDDNTNMLNSYSEMFANTEIKNIVIKGEGGTGKSTWCKRLLYAWCQVQRRKLGMEGASDEANSDMEESLKRFDYLFYVTLRHVKHQSPLKDILLFTGLDRLSVKRNVCELILANSSENVLILLDGYDEYPFTLDCQGLGHSTIVMTTRTWKYNGLRSRDNNFKVDAVSEIRGLTAPGVRKLSRKVIASYSKQYPDMGLKSSDEKEQANVFLKDCRSAGLSDSIKIPLILIITVLTWLENKKSLSKSLTCNILGLLEVIFQRGKNKLSQTDKQTLNRAEQEKKEPSALHEGITAKYKFMCDNQLLLQHLGRLAYKGLTNQKKELSLVFLEDELHEFLESEELEICYKLGLLTRSAVATSSLGPAQVSISFNHKLIQDLYAAIGIISSSDNLSGFTKILTSITAVLEMKNVIPFITALNPSTGSDLNKHIAGLAETDALLCLGRKDVGSSIMRDDRREDDRSSIMRNYNKLLFDCMSEWDSVHDDRKKQKQLYLTDLIIKSDFERKLRLCTYHNMEHLKLLRVSKAIQSRESVDIKQMLSQLTTLTSKAASLNFLFIDLELINLEQVRYGDRQPMDFDLTKNEHLEHVEIKAPVSDFFCLTFNETVQLRRVEIQNAIINLLDLQKVNSLKLKYVNMKEIRLPTRLEELQYVRLHYVTMPGSSWNSFFQILQSPSLTELSIEKMDIDDIAINLETSSKLEVLQLKNVKVRELRLPTRLEKLNYVSLESVTIPKPSWNSLFKFLQSPSLDWRSLTNLNIDGITINLETSSGLQKIQLKDVKVREIRLPTRLEKLNYVSLESVTIPESSWNSFFKSLQSPSLEWLILKNPNIDDITINLEISSKLKLLVLNNVKMKEIRLPTRLEKLEYVILESVTLPESSWNSLFQILQSLSLEWLLLWNPNIDDITINLEISSKLKVLQLKNVKMKEIRLPTRREKLEYVLLESVTLPESSWNSLFQILQSLSLEWLLLKNPNIEDITINLEISSKLKVLQLKNVKMKEIRLPTRLKKLIYVSLESVTIPESSWNSFLKSLQSPSLEWLILKNPNIDDITINLEISSELKVLRLENVRMKEIRLPTGLEKLTYVSLESVTIPESSWNSFLKSLQSLSIEWLMVKNLILKT